METKEILKSLRKSKGFTNMKDFCEAIDISVNTYQNYESGKRIPTADILIKLADFYGVTTDYLLGRPEAKLPESPIDEFAKAERLKELEKIIIKEYLELGNEEREAVLDFIRNCIKKEEERKKSQEIHIFKRIARGNQSENHLDPAEELEKIRMEKLEDPDM